MGATNQPQEEDHMQSENHEKRTHDELLTLDELAFILKVPAATIRKWRSAREGPPGFRVGKYVRFRRSAVEQYITEREKADDDR
jgi:excisionase family DNA binding protein